MAQVSMPDGAVVELPDNPPPELKKAIQAKVELFHLQAARGKAVQAAAADREKRYGKRNYLAEATSPAVENIDNEISKRKDALAKFKSDNGNFWDKTKYYGSQVGSAVARGLLSLPALAGAAGIAGDPMRYKSSPSDITTSVSKVGRRPQTVGEKYLASAVEAGTGALVGPGAVAAPLKTAVIGASSGLGSEAAAQVTGDNPLARVLGGLAGGVVPSIASSLKTTRNTLARETLRDASPKDLARAKALMEEARVQGIPLNLSQAMPHSSNVDRVVEELSRSPHGKEVARLLRNQPQDVELATTRELGTLPGTARDQHTAANNVQEIATGALNNLKAQRTALWRDTLDKGIAAIKAAKQKGVEASTSNLIGAKTAYGQANALRVKLEQKIPELQAALKAAQSGDARAVAHANAQVAATQRMIQELESFPLPRGAIADNRGKLLGEAGRGESIGYDALARQAQANALRRKMPPEVQAAPSLETLTAERNLAQGQQAVGQAAARESLAARAAEQARRKLAGAKAAVANATEVPPQAVEKEAARLRELASGELKNTPKGKALEQLAASFYDAEGAPITSSQNLNELLKAAGAKLKTLNIDTPGMDAGATKFIQGQIGQARGNLGASFKPIQAANRAYQEFTESVYNPAKQGVVGRVAGKGFDASKEAVTSRVFNVFEKGTLPGTKSEILTLERSMRGQQNGAEIFQDAVKTHLAEKVSAALKDSGGRLSENAAGDISRALFGTPSSQQGFRDMMVGLARSKGLPDNTYVTGMEKLMKTISMASRRPKEIAGVTAEGLDRASRSRLLGRVGNFSVIQPFRQAFKAADDWLNADAYSFMDKLLTSPEGVDTLVKIGREPLMSPAAVNAFATFIGTTSTAQNPEQQK